MPSKCLEKRQADEALERIADYVDKYEIDSQEAFSTARLCLADAIGCAILSLQFPACTKLLGPIVPETIVPQGVPIPGTSFILDPIKAAFDIGTMIRWLDYNDTWLAAEWGHPSDNLGGILAIADYLSRQHIAEGKPPLKMHEVLKAMIKAHEIQGNLALLNSFNRIGFDHVILVKIATTAVVANLLGANRDQIVDALSNAWIDAGPLRTYRHHPNTGSRKSWAAGDATSRGVMFAWITMRGEMGYPQGLTARKWGVYDVLFQGKPLQFDRPFTSYVMENILFKIAFPAEFHAQTAVECAFNLHPQVKERWDVIDRIEITTHESALRIIDKTGPLNNPADRDHCLQYMVAVALLYGRLTAHDYEDSTAQDPRIDILRNKMDLKENKQYTTDYLDPDKRSIPNAIQIFFTDGSHTERQAVEYPLGHRKRRQEGIPLLFEKCKNNLLTRFPPEQTQAIFNVLHHPATLDSMPVHTFMDLLIK